jgi:hypothetical protein
MKLAVVGMGLASPAGATTREHVFALRTGSPPVWPSPFTTPEGDAITVRFCPWIGAHLPYAARLGVMTALAVEEARAMLPVALRQPLGRAGLIVGWDDTAPWTDAERADVERGLGTLVAAGRVERFLGAAFFVRALRRAAEQLAEGIEVVAIVGADSLVTLDHALAMVQDPPTSWDKEPSPPGEGAAALLLTTPALAQERGLTIVGTIIGSASERAASNDDNQEIVDGDALTAVVRQLPIDTPVRVVAGQFPLDELRETEWWMASARSVAKIHPQHSSYCLEVASGRVGAAAGLMSLCYGLAVLRHQAATRRDSSAGPLLAWAIARDGVRGACLATVPAP